MSLRPGPIPTSDRHIGMIEADRFHREHAVVELAIRDLKEGAGLEQIPSGHFHANGAWLGCSVLAHNIGIWSSLMAASQRLPTAPDAPALSQWSQ